MASTVSKIYTTAIHTTSRTTTRRRLFDCLGWSASALAFLLLGAAMVWILVMVFIYGYHSLTPKVITQVTEGTGAGSSTLSRAHSFWLSAASSWPSRWGLEPAFISRNSITDLWLRSYASWPMS